jgi:hypothetical protein
MTVSAALGGLSRLGPPAAAAATPKFAMEIVPLAGFWIAYLTFMVSVLVGVAWLFRGHGGRKSRPGGEVE